jgi:hypothetical protein
VRPSDFRYALVNPDIHTALDLYAFVAVTGSATSLDALIQLVRSDNNRRQDEMNRLGASTPRQLDVRCLLVNPSTLFIDRL